MKLGETVTYPGLERVSLCGHILYGLCMPSGFGGRPGSEVSVGHIFTWAVLETVNPTLMGGRPGDGRATVRAR